jgi:iron complex outermembrane receptor protein
LLWTPSNRQTIWGAVSRAVRTPSRADQGIRVNAAAFPVEGGTTAVLALIGSENATSEKLNAFELGYRAQPARKLFLDIATFYNSYDHLTTSEPGRPFFEFGPQPHLVIPLLFSNLMRGETYGVEASVGWNPTHYWRFNGGYSFLRMQLHPYTTSQDDKSEGAEGQSPRHQFQLHSFLTLPRNFELDTSLYHVSTRVTDSIPSYTRLDARLAWHVRENIELSAVMQNLLDGHHPEFSGIGSLTSEPKRGAYGKLTWHF